MSKAFMLINPFCSLTPAFSAAPPCGQPAEQFLAGPGSVYQEWECWVSGAEPDSWAAHSPLADLRALGTLWPHLPGLPWTLHPGPPAASILRSWPPHLPQGAPHCHEGTGLWPSQLEEPGGEFNDKIFSQQIHTSIVCPLMFISEWCII